MKKHIDEILMIVYTVFLAVIIFYISSCSPQYHLNKFHKKGGKIECVGDTVQVKIPVPKLIKGEIQYVDSLIEIPCPETEINFPPSKQEIRYRYRLDKKALNDSVNLVKKKYDFDLKKADKDNKAELKLKDKELKALNIQIRAANKANKSSVFWTWIGKRWYLLLIAGYLIRLFQPIIWKLIKSRLYS